MSLLRLWPDSAVRRSVETDGVSLRAWAVNDVLDAALAASGAEIAEIFLRQANGAGLALAGFRGPFAQAFAQITRFNEGQGYPGLVAMQGRPLEASDAPADIRFLRTLVKEAGFHYFLCVPIPGRQRPIGCLDVAWRKDGHHPASLSVVLSREAERLALILDHEEAGSLHGDQTNTGELAAASEGRLALRLLGNFEAYLNGVPLSVGDFSRRRSLMLLKILATNYGKALSRDELIDLFWPSGAPEDAPQLLKSAAHYLRRALGEAHDEKAKTQFITTAANGYALNPASCHWIDAIEFKRLAEEGLRLERQGRWRESTVALEAAADLYRGDYLEDEPYSEWAIKQRRQLKELLLDILQATARLLSMAGDYEASVRRYRAILQVDPCLEEVHRDLMEVLCRSGKRIQALRQFEACRRALKEEFDSSPLFETEALYRSILNGATG